jgi:amino acid adenylation domain-containing protein/non-ribosomal peptide synthase protein (TIGR01720 family)
LRAALFTLQGDKHLLVLTLPALAADLTTLQKLVVEIGQQYAALLHGGEYVADVIQYADLSEWQNELLESDETNQGRAYWRSQACSAAQALKLPGAKRGFEQEAYQARSCTGALPASLTDELAQLSRASRSSIEALLLACWQTLLWRLTGAREIVVHTAFAGRRYAELEHALGLCTRYLPVCAQLEKRLSFADLGKAVGAKLSEAHAWQDYFIEENDLLSPANKGAARIGFEYMDWPRPFEVAELSISFAKLYSLCDHFDLKLSCFHTEHSMLLELHYNAAVFPADAIERLAAQLHTLIASALAQPDNTISRLEILSNSERQQLLTEFNATALESLHAQCIHREFERQVDQTPEAVAAVCHNEQLSYRELNARANQLAHFLQAQGVGPDVVVGICLARSIDLLVALLGILKSGGAYLPLEPSYPQERLAFMLADAKVELLITEQKLRHLLPQTTKLFVIDEDRERISRHSRENPQSAVVVENLAYVIYTSGSTGRPKGVAVPHRGLCNYLRWCTAAYRVGEGQGAPVHSPLAFDLTVTSIFAPLLTGRKIVLLAEEQTTCAALATALRKREDFSLVKLTPAHLEWLSYSLQDDEVAGATRALIVGGEALNAESLSFWREHAPATRIINEYGPTETVVGCCVYEVPAGEPLNGALPIGRPIANTQLYILDEQMNPAPFLVVGEIYIGGVGVARGYLHCPDITAERFVPDPFSRNAGQRLYKTGDLGRYRPDGIVEFLGRRDQQIKLKGYRIELGEIEAVLCEHEAVREAVVTLGAEAEGDKRLIGYVGARDRAKLNSSELRAYLQRRLPEYMIPSLFVVLERLPLTTNGKVDRAALPPPEQLLLEPDEQYAAPRNRTEEILAGIWAEILGLERVGINDNFFELGGDSIRGIQTIARANRVGVHLTPQQLFQQQTIARLAAVAGLLPAVQTEQGPVQGVVPLTPIQRWFFARDLAEPDHFNQSVLLEVRAGRDFLLLKQAVGLLLAQHDALRLRFARTTSGWQQYHATLDEPAPVAQITLSASTEEEYQAAIAAAVAELQPTLNLRQGPMLRFTLFHSTQGLPDRLHVAIHHLVTDGVSWRILLEDLQLCYEQLTRGQDVRLPPKTTAYQYWAEQLSTYARSQTLRGEAAYWLAAAGTFRHPLPLDFKREPDSNTMAAARTVHVSLSPEETKALLYDVPQSYRVQVQELLLTALARTFAQWTNTNSLLLWLESHGRQEIFGDVDLSRTVGWFTSLFPLRLALPSESSELGDELKAVKEQLRRVPYQGLGYGLLRYLNDDPQIVAQLEALPQPEVLFNYFGNFDHILPASAPFRICRETMAADRSLQTGRDVLLEVNAYVLDGRLTSVWTYSSKLHRHETIAALAKGFSESVQLLINYCQTAETTGYTPADFPKSKLNQQELDHLLAKLMAARGDSA